MIEIRGLTVELGGRRVLSGIDLDVRGGEAVALCGPNGAGKTTLLRSVLGLVPFRGSVRIRGFDVTLAPVAAKRSLGYVPQTPAHLEDTAIASLRFVAAVRGAAQGNLDALLARVGLGGVARQSIRTFSAGMKQRLSLAAALIGSPDLLVLDEPTASLDAGGQADFVGIFRELHAAGCTVLLCSHRESEVRAVAERVVQIEDGRVAPRAMTSIVAGTGLPLAVAAGRGVA